jgi:general secretion pathway protein G
MKFFNTKNRGERGFTLIELLVVISIIGLLSSVVLAALGGTREKAKNAKLKQEIVQMRNAFELARSTDGTYPFTTSNKRIISLNYNSEITNIAAEISNTNGNSYSGGTASGIYTFSDVVSPGVTGYAIYVGILPVDTTYICLDSQGKTTTGPIAGFWADSNQMGGGYCR